MPTSMRKLGSPVAALGNQGREISSKPVSNQKSNHQEQLVIDDSATYERQLEQLERALHGEKQIETNLGCCGNGDPPTFERRSCVIN